MATPLRAEIVSMVIDGNMLRYRMSKWPELLPDPSKNVVTPGELWPFIAATLEEPLARLALAEIRTATDSPDDILFVAYRALKVCGSGFWMEIRTRGPRAGAPGKACVRRSG